MNDHLILACATISILSGFVKEGAFNKMLSMFIASIFIILMIYDDVNKIFIAVLISFITHLTLILTCKEHKIS